MNARPILEVLAEHGVEFVVLTTTSPAGRSDRRTQKLEICFEQTWTNCECLARALEQIDAKLEVPHRAPLPWLMDLRAADRPLHFSSRFGRVLVQPPGSDLGSYDALLGTAARTTVEGVDVHVHARRATAKRRASSRACGTAPAYGDEQAERLSSDEASDPDLPN